MVFAKTMFATTSAIVASIITSFSVAHAFHPSLLSKALGPDEEIPTCEECSPPPGLVDGVFSLRDADDYKVDPKLGPLESYSGFFTTMSSDSFNNSMFWWYFPPQSGNLSAPTLIWLQGGPGGSSLFGLFAEMGPYRVREDLSLELRNTTWNKAYGMLFIDNPVGAGFSYTTGDEGYCTDSKHDVATNLYSLLEQFYGVFPHLATGSPLYVTGESYGGHYVPAISHYIHLKNNDPKTPPKVRIPLAGLAIGDGWVDPINMIPQYPEFFFNTGLVDTHQKAVIQSMCDETVSLIDDERYEQAFEVWDRMLNGDIWPFHNLFHNMTGSNDYDNFMNDDAPPEFGYYAKYVTRPDVREWIHVGNAVFNDGKQCELHLVSDFMRSLKPELADLMEAGYKVLVYSGQLDIIIAAALTERFLQTVEWKGQAEYKTAERMVWRTSQDSPHVAGFARQVDNFSQVLVRGAGHIVPADQAEAALDMITRFVEGEAYENLPDPVARLAESESKLRESERIVAALVPDGA